MPERPAAKLRPEVEMVLCCARAKTDTDTRTRMNALLQGPLDWEYLLDMAQRHGLLPLLFRHLRHTAPEAIPHTYRQRMQDFFNRNASRNLLLDAELQRLMKLFEAHRIQALPYKGPALARLAYGDLAWRCFSDLDVLISERDLKRATDILLTHGYNSPYNISSARHADFLRSCGEQAFTRSDGPIYLDIHWSLTPPSLSRSFKAEPFLAMAKNDIRQEDSQLSLPIEDLLLVLCVHNGRELWKRLSWISDFAELVSAHPNLNWELMVEKAKCAGVRRMLFLGLFLTHQLLKVDLPKRILRAAEQEANVKALARQVQENFSDDPFSNIRLWEACVFHLKVRERLRDGIRYCLHLILRPKPEEWAAVPLPDSLRAFYYVIRPIRIIKRKLLPAGGQPPKRQVNFCSDE